MDDALIDEADAPWLRQQAAAKVVQATGSPFEAANDDAPDGVVTDDPFDPLRYWGYFTGTD
jgi:hypothetical protein